MEQRCCRRATAKQAIIIHLQDICHSQHNLHPQVMLWCLSWITDNCWTRKQLSHHFIPTRALPFFPFTLFLFYFISFTFHFLTFPFLCPLSFLLCFVFSFAYPFLHSSLYFIVSTSSFILLSSFFPFLFILFLFRFCFVPLLSSFFSFLSLLSFSPSLLLISLFQYLFLFLSYCFRSISFHCLFLFPCLSLIFCLSFSLLCSSFPYPAEIQLYWQSFSEPIPGD